MVDSTQRGNNSGNGWPYSLGWIVLLGVLGTCFILPPLFHLNIKPNQYAPGFLPLRMINADLKFMVVMVCMSLAGGSFMVSMHLRGRCRKLPKVFLLFVCLFLVSVFISTIISHNPMRAWVSSLQWHIIPLLFALCLGQVAWSRKFIIWVIGLLLAGGFASSLITLDQHYQWTDWSHRLVRTGYAGIIYNHNFAAEYHAPLIPLGLGLFFYLRSRWGRAICLFLILGIFLPAVSLSMARGAWVGHIGGAVGAVFLFVVFLKFQSKGHNSALSHGGRQVPVAFILLGLAIPAYLYTSDFWKKGGAGWDRLFPEEPVQLGSKSTTTKNHTNKAKSPAPVISETSEARELKSVVDFEDYSVNRRFVLWEDAFRECFSKDFLFGKGTDHYELFYHQSAELSDKNWGKTLVRFVHNDFIQTFYENGIVGIIGWLGIWGFILWAGLMSSVRLFRNGDTSELGLRFGLITCILCFLIESFFEFPSRSPCAMFVGWSTLGILLGLNLQMQRGDEINQDFDLKKRPLLNLGIGVIGVVLPIYSCFLAKDLFWANVYHFQGRAAADAKKPQLSLHFHREAIDHAPWQHLSRKAEGFLLITQEKRFLDAMKSIEKTLEVHPGCLQAHQNRIALLINEFKNLQAAKVAFLDMKNAAPFHPFTRQEEQKLKHVFENSSPVSISQPVRITKSKN
jgi:hypothetical protein